KPAWIRVPSIPVRNGAGDLSLVATPRRQLGLLPHSGKPPKPTVAAERQQPAPPREPLRTRVPFIPVRRRRPTAHRRGPTTPTSRRRRPTATAQSLPYSGKSADPQHGDERRRLASCAAETGGVAAEQKPDSAAVRTSLFRTLGYPTLHDQ